MALQHLKRSTAASQARPSRRLQLPVRAYVTDSSSVPPNVAEARAWIAAWRAQQGHQAAASPAASSVPPNVAEARAWIAAWREQQKHLSPSASPVATPVPPPTANAPAAAAIHSPKVSPDGTVTFTKQLLDATCAVELMSKLQKKENRAQ